MRSSNGLNNAGGFERLQEHVASSAFYKSIDYAEHNDITKNAVAQAFAWIIQEGDRTERHRMAEQSHDYGQGIWVSFPCGNVH